MTESTGVGRGRGGGVPPRPPEPPVELPDHIRHGGSTAYHQPYRCRCEECQEWRRSYDRDRMERVRLTFEYRERGYRK